VALLAHQVAEEMEAAALHTIVPVGADRESRRAPTTTTQTERRRAVRVRRRNSQTLKFSAQKILEFHAKARQGNTYRSFNPRPTDRPLSHIPFLVRPGKLPLLRDLSFLFRSASSPPPLFAAAFSCALLLASRSYMMIAPAVATL
jgi:hypothetical protein